VTDYHPRTKRPSSFELPYVGRLGLEPRLVSGIWSGQECGLVLIFKKNPFRVITATEKELQPGGLSGEVRGYYAGGFTSHQLDVVYACCEGGVNLCRDVRLRRF